MPVVINGSTGITFPAGGTGNPAGTVVGTTDTQTLSGKTISGNLNMTGGSKYQVSGVTTNALAWCNFTVSGTTVTVQSSYNVSSIVRNSTGSYNCNFTNALTDAKYSVTGNASINTAGSYYCVFILNTAGAPTTTAFNFGIQGLNNTTYDANYVSLAVFGN